MRTDSIITATTVVYTVQQSLALNNYEDWQHYYSHYGGIHTAAIISTQ